MRRVWAIARQTLRLAVRSKLVLTLLALLLAAIVAVPLQVKGDGTLKGEVQVLLTYSLGLAWVLLSMATLWAGCAAISAEIRGKQAHVLLSLPVHRWQVWLGKWLGLTVLNALLLAAAGLLLRLGQPDLLGQIKIPVIGPFFEAMSAAATPSSATSPYCSPWAWPSASPRRRTARPPCLRWPATWS